jgi:hypothetical protein
MDMPTIGEPIAAGPIRSGVDRQTVRATLRGTKHLEQEENATNATSISPPTRFRRQMLASSQPCLFEDYLTHLWTAYSPYVNISLNSWSPSRVDWPVCRSCRMICSILSRNMHRLSCPFPLTSLTDPLHSSHRQARPSPLPPRFPPHRPLPL